MAIYGWKITGRKFKWGPAVAILELAPWFLTEEVREVRTFRDQEAGLIIVSHAKLVFAGCFTQWVIRNKIVINNWKEGDRAFAVEAGFSVGAAKRRGFNFNSLLILT